MPTGLMFGGIDDGWDDDARDTMPVVIPGAPKSGEIVLCVGFSTGRANARIKGASAEEVGALVRGWEARRSGGTPPVPHPS